MSKTYMRSVRPVTLIVIKQFIFKVCHPAHYIRPETTINYTMIYHIATMAIALWSMSLGY